MSFRACIGVAGCVSIHALILLSALVAGGLPVAAIAAPAEVSLQETVRRAIERAPMLDARRARIEAARQESYRAGALPDPMLMVGIDNLPITGADAFDTGADFMTMKKIGVRQEIPARAKREARRTLAARALDEAIALSDAERLAVRRAAAAAWIDVWSTQRELTALQALRDEAALAAKLANVFHGPFLRCPSDRLDSKTWAVRRLFPRPGRRSDDSRAVSLIGQSPGRPRQVGEAIV